MGEFFIGRGGKIYTILRGEWGRISPNIWHKKNTEMDQSDAYSGLGFLGPGQQIGI